MGIVLAFFFYPHSADLSVIACNKKFQNAGNSCRISHAILSCFMQPGPGPLQYNSAGHFSLHFLPLD